MNSFSYHITSKSYFIDEEKTKKYSCPGLRHDKGIDSNYSCMS